MLIFVAIRNWYFSILLLLEVKWTSCTWKNIRFKSRKVLPPPLRKSGRITDHSPDFLRLKLLKWNLILMPYFQHFSAAFALVFQNEKILPLISGRGFMYFSFWYFARGTEFIVFCSQWRMISENDLDLSWYTFLQIRCPYFACNNALLTFIIWKSLFRLCLAVLHRNKSVNKCMLVARPNMKTVGCESVGWKFFVIEELFLLHRKWLNPKLKSSFSLERCITLKVE